jgi:predicted ATPase
MPYTSPLPSSESIAPPSLEDALVTDEMRAPLTGLIGRQKELVRRVGPAYPDGVHFVALAAVTRAEAVSTAVAESLGLHDNGSVGMEEQTVRYFAGRRALLVLDDFEHVLEAAPFVSTLLAAAPNLTVLVTSRAPLRLQGEQELPVPPLSLPLSGAHSAARIADAESTRLFVQRARAGRPDFAVTDTNAKDIAGICRRLDGLPLAIELAAARVKLLAPRAILARLQQRFDLLRSEARDADPRHRTLRDVIDWSYDLLTPAEQALFAELSVSAGGVSLDAATAIATLDPEESDLDVLDRISSLADKSLVRQREDAEGEPRFGMLETVRDYGIGRLRATACEAAVRVGHLQYVLRFAEESEWHLRGPEQTRWFDRLAQEHDNLRAALDHALASDDIVTAARLAAALHRFRLTRGYLGEGTERLWAVDACIGDHGTHTVPLKTQATIKAALGLLTGVRSELRVSCATSRPPVRSRSPDATRTQPRSRSTIAAGSPTCAVSWTWRSRSRRRRSTITSGPATCSASPTRTPISVGSHRRAGRSRKRSAGSRWR